MWDDKTDSADKDNFFDNETENPETKMEVVASFTKGLELVPMKAKVARVPL